MRKALTLFVDVGSHRFGLGRKSERDFVESSSESGSGGPGPPTSTMWRRTDSPVRSNLWLDQMSSGAVESRVMKDSLDRTEGQDPRRRQGYTVLNRGYSPFRLYSEPTQYLVRQKIALHAFPLGDMRHHPEGNLGVTLRQLMP